MHGRCEGPDQGYSHIAAIEVFALGVGGALVVVVEMVTETTMFQELWVGPWLDREWLAGASGTLRSVAAVLVAALTPRCPVRAPGECCMWSTGDRGH